MAKNPPPIEVEKLGEQEREFAASRRRIVIPFLIAVSSGLMLGMARLVLSGREQRFITWLGVGLLGLGFLVILLVFAQRDMKVTIFEKGLVAYRGKQYVVVRWNSIAKLWDEVSRVQAVPFVGAANHAYTIELRNDQKLHFTNDLQDVTELGAILRERTLLTLLEQAMKDYEKGRLMDFGPFSMSKTSIRSGGEDTSWNEIESIALDEDALTVRRKGEEGFWLNAPAAKIPNPHVLSALLARRE